MLAEQCRRLGVDIEASSSQAAALSQASNGVAVSRKKPSWNLDISSIHRRIKDDIRNSSSNSSSRMQASGAASESSEQLPLPPGWEVSKCSIYVFRVNSIQVSNSEIAQIMMFVAAWTAYGVGVGFQSDKQR